MNMYGRFLAALLCGLLLQGCSSSKNNDVNVPQIPSSGPIGSYAEFMGYGQIPVDGYGLVGGLPGTGSAECPPQIRAELKQFIATQLPKESGITADELLNSKDNAVVTIEGLIEPGALKGEPFDLKVSALPGSQTISLAGGHLYPCKLMLTKSSRRLASGSGPIFLNSIDNNDLLQGYVLGGGAVIEQYSLNLALFASDFALANAIRNKINERFGDDTASAPSAALVKVNFPAEYRDNKLKFIALLKTLYLGETKQQQDERAIRLIQELGEPNKAAQAEYALEAIGRTEQDQLIEAIKSNNAEIKFHAARCLLSMGNDAGLSNLITIANDTSNVHKIEAIEAIAYDAKRSDARSILYPLLNNQDFKARLVVYEKLRKLSAPAITTLRIADDFEIDVVQSSGPAMVYVYRKGQQRIVLFGSPIELARDVYVESKSGDIILNSDPNKKFINVIRKHPKRNTVMGPLKSGYDLREILITLCEMPPQQNSQKRIFGLGASYNDAVELLKIMSQKKLINAEFEAGELPKTSLYIAESKQTKTINTNNSETPKTIAK